MEIALAQRNYIVADLAGNAARIPARYGTRRFAAPVW